MMSRIIKIIILVVIVTFLGYVGLSIWSGACAGPGSKQVDIPSVEQATYSFGINNTGGLIFSSDYEQKGQNVGGRVFTLHGFWEMRGKKFKFVPHDIMLDENIFGEITVKRR